MYLYFNTVNIIIQLQIFRFCLLVNISNFGSMDKKTSENSIHYLSLLDENKSYMSYYIYLKTYHETII